MSQPGSTPMVALAVQRIELSENDEVLAVTGGDDRVYQKLSDVVLDRVKFTDPVTGLSGEISVAGLDFVLKALANRWTAQKLSCELDPETSWPINCRS